MSLSRIVGFASTLIAMGTLASACGLAGPPEGPGDGADSDGGSAGVGGDTGSGPGSGETTGGENGTSGQTTTGGGTEPECPHEGPPVLDANTLDVCPTCNGGARCLPSSLVPPEFSDQLGDCDADNKCVPDLFIETGGEFIPPTCDSVGGVEGRCLSECLPQVAEQAANLPQSSCGAYEKCVPCYDPLDGTETGSCSLSCDPGPTEPPQQLPKCCDGIGTCVPSSAVPPDKLDKLQQDVCPPGDLVCAPDVFVNDPNYSPASCQTSLLSSVLGSEYGPGACLPACINGVDNFMVQEDGCGAGFKCAPCLEPPFGTPSGACEL